MLPLQMYSEMRLLAEFKYGLALDDIHLTEHSQDFDVHKVVQNLQTFVEKYSYNMVKQVLHFLSFVVIVLML